MFLLVGLGNQGKEYQNTRHNFGFLTLDQIVSDYNLENAGKKFSSEVFLGQINSEKIIAIKPQTYMNLSGDAVLKAQSFYKIPLQNIIIFHDDLDLELSRIKTKIGGSHAGHNGLRDIDEKIGKEYVRVRLGIGRPQNPAYEVSDYVLSKFSASEMEIVKTVNEKISKLLPLILEKKPDEFINKFNNSNN